MRFVKLSEKIVNWEWFTDGNMLKVWIYLLAKAQQFEPGRYKGIEVDVGQVITGRKAIARDTGLTERQVRTCLNKLKMTGEIAIKTTNQYSVITIVKYSDYQDNHKTNDQQDGQQTVQPKSNGSPTEVQRMSTSKIEREIEGKNNKLNADRQRTFQKPTIEEIRDYCIEKGYADIQAEKFYDYYEKNNWTVKEKNGRRKMSNWKLCLNSWVVNEIRYNSTNDLKNRAREAYIKDVERKQKYDDKKEGGTWFD